MFFLLGGNDKKARKAEKQTRASDATARVRDVFLAGRFPVVTTHQVEGRRIAKVLGLVCCRGYDSEEAFFGMAGRAMNKGAQAIVAIMKMWPFILTAANISPASVRPSCLNTTRRTRIPCRSCSSRNSGSGSSSPTAI